LIVLIVSLGDGSYAISVCLTCLFLAAAFVTLKEPAE